MRSQSSEVSERCSGSFWDPYTRELSISRENKHSEGSPSRNPDLRAFDLRTLKQVILVNMIRLTVSSSVEELIWPGIPFFGAKRSGPTVG